MLDINSEVKIKLFISEICLQSKIIVEKQSREDNLYRASPSFNLLYGQIIMKINVAMIVSLLYNCLNVF